jgi:hypothetical protein
MNLIFYFIKQFIISHAQNIFKKMEKPLEAWMFYGGGTYIFAFINWTSALQDANLLFSFFGTFASTFLVLVKIAEKYGFLPKFLKKGQNTEGVENEE